MIFTHSEEKNCVSLIQRERGREINVIQRNGVTLCVTEEAHILIHTYYRKLKQPYNICVKEKRERKMRNKL